MSDFQLILVMFFKELIQIFGKNVTEVLINVFISLEMKKVLPMMKMVLYSLMLCMIRFFLVILS